MPKTKISLNLWKRVADAHKTVEQTVSKTFSKGEEHTWK